MYITLDGHHYAAVRLPVADATRLLRNNRLRQVRNGHWCED